MISHLNNNGYSDRTARLDVDTAIMPQALQFLGDAGFKIEGSDVSPPHLQGVIRLRIRGSALPEACEHGCPMIRLVFQQEVYGTQRIYRIAETVLLDWPETAVA